MNFFRVFLVSSLILFQFGGTIIEAQVANCQIKPKNVKKVNVFVFINGGTRVDEIWYSRYCSWRDRGMPYNTYAPVTVKVGGAITCDENNKCNCPNTDSNEVDCKPTFLYVCAEQILGQEEFKKLLCCSAQIKKPGSTKSKGFKQCVMEQPDLGEKISDCMKQTGDASPQAIALKNAQEVVDAGVDLTNNTEPFFFYNGKFDKCISDDSPNYFLQKICAMLKFDIAASISQCVKAGGW